MKALNNLRWAIAAVSVALSFYAHAYPGESMVLDPVTGNYSITYWDDATYGDTAFEQPSLRHTTFVPATKITPTIRSKFRLGDVGSVVYSYTVSNGASAKQSIVGLVLPQTARIKGARDFPAITANEKEVEQALLANMSALDSPKDWSGNIYTVRGQSRISWSQDEPETGGVKAGRTQAGFAFSSTALPGISEARVKGFGAVFGYAGDGPAEDSAILAELDRLMENDFIARPAAVPMIAVPAPFDAAVLLDRIQTHTHTWIAKQLLDATFASQLDRYLVAAADAYRRNQPKAGKEHIRTLRKMLKKEHEDVDKDDEKEGGKHDGKGDDKGAKDKRPPIARLAARVLDFDLKYVMKRMGGDKDD